jgi:hypothetical protein
MYEKLNPSDWSCLLSCVHEDIVVVMIIVDVSLGVVVVVGARTRIAHLQSERPARSF